MNRFFLFLILLASMAACSNEQEAGNESSSKVKVVAQQNGISYYGSFFDLTNAISGEQLHSLMDSSHDCQAVIFGKVADVCKKEGCWLNLDCGGNSILQVSLHKFHVPKDCEGRMAYISGRAFLDTTSVEKLRDFAEDAGKSASEIDAINKPKVEMVFEARGVGLK
jgi:hypothetical protein